MRTFTTLTVLAIGAGMAALYMQDADLSEIPSVQTTDLVNENQTAAPPVLTAPRGKIHTTQGSELFAPQTAAPQTTGAVAIEAALTEDATGSQDALTVAVPTGPLLRSATTAAPIDTAVPVPGGGRLHFTPDRPMSASPVLPEADAHGDAEPPVDAYEEANTAPARTYVRRSVPRKTQRQRQARRNNHIESLFINPLGTR